MSGAEDSQIWAAKQDWLKRVMATPGLRSGAKMLAWEVLNRAWGSRLTSHPGRDTIQADLGLKSTGRLDEYRKELKAIGAVDTETLYKGNKPYTAYTINLDYGLGTIVLDEDAVTSTIVPDTEHHGEGPSTIVPDTEHRRALKPSSNPSKEERKTTRREEDQAPSGEKRESKRLTMEDLIDIYGLAEVSEAQDMVGVNDREKTRVVARYLRGRSTPVEDPQEKPVVEKKRQEKSVETKTVDLVEIFGDALDGIDLTRVWSKAGSDLTFGQWKQSEDAVADIRRSLLRAVV